MKTPLFWMLLIAWAAPAHGQFSDYVNFQGFAELNGQPLSPDSPTNYRIEFRIYDAPGGGKVLWSEAQTVTVYGGVFNTILGMGEDLQEGGEPSPTLSQILGSSECWIAYRIPVVAREDLGARQRVASEAQAFVANRLAARSVTTIQFVPQSIGSESLAAEAVGASAIAPRSVRTAALAANGVQGIHLIHGSVTAADFQAGTFTVDQLAPVEDADFASDSITAVDLANGAFTGSVLAENSISLSKLATGTLNASNVLGQRAVRPSDFSPGTVATTRFYANPENASIYGPIANESQTIPFLFERYHYTEWGFHRTQDFFFGAHIFAQNGRWVIYADTWPSRGWISNTASVIFLPRPAVQLR